MEHPAVAEAGVIGVPDPVAGERRQGVRRAAPGLRADATSCDASCSRYGRPRLGAAVAPREIAFAAAAAPHPQRQDHAPPAAGPRARACPRATCRRWSAAMSADAGDLRSPDEQLELLRADAAASGASRSAAPSSTAPARSAASCTSTSARRRSPSACSAALRAPTTPWWRPTASTATRWLAASPAGAVMAEMFGRGRGLQPAGGAARCTSSTSRRRFYGGNAIVGGGLPVAVGLALADRLRGRDRVDGLLLRRGRRGRGRVPRVA